MPSPKRIADLTPDDLRRHRWCHFHDDEHGCDAFEWAVPDGHPAFDPEVTELELATFRFQDGQEAPGMFDGAACFSVYLGGEWHAFWTGVRIPSDSERQHLGACLARLGLALPVVATAVWSRRSECYGGIRHLDAQDRQAGRAVTLTGWRAPSGTRPY